MTLYDSAKKDFLKTIDAIARRHTPEQVFTDFVSPTAIFKLMRFVQSEWRFVMKSKL